MDSDFVIDCFLGQSCVEGTIVHPYWRNSMLHQCALLSRELKALGTDVVHDLTRASETTLLEKRNDMFHFVAIFSLTFQILQLALVQSASLSFAVWLFIDSLVMRC